MTENQFNAKHIRSLNKLIRRIRSTKEMVLRYKQLGMSSLHIRVYSHASLASNADNSLQLGCLKFLCDNKNDCHILSYCSQKSKRIVRSIMAGEVFVFSAAFDQAFVIRHDIQLILGTPIPLMMFTDSKQLFNVISRTSLTTEKRLMDEIMAAREAYNRYEISNVGLVSGKSSPADGLTKPGVCVQLSNLFYRGKDNTHVLQWIIR